MRLLLPLVYVARSTAGSLVLLTILQASCTAEILSAGGERPVTPLATPVTDFMTPSSDGGPLDLLGQLQQVPGLTVAAASTANTGYEAYSLSYDQPVDHAAPAGQRFNQRMLLFHRGAAAPMVISTTGYDLYDADVLSEPTTALAANELKLEHRYFSPSRPSPTPWSLDTISQAAADHHRIIQALRPIYQGRWISTGVSKGGMTSVFHRRFYPEDVHATVAYVAPLSFSQADGRYPAFLSAVGTVACRQQLTSFMRTVLGRRAAMLQRIASQNYSLTLLGAEACLEDTVTGFAFTFWQYSGISLCSSIPGNTATDSEVFTFLASVGYLDGCDDSFLRALEPYVYQSATQLGGPAASSTAPIADLLHHPSPPVANPYCAEACSAGTTFDAGAMADIDKWVRGSGARLLFVYGGNDPWTAGAFELGAALDSYRYVVKDGTHAAAIADLPASELSAAAQTLARWANVPVASVKLQRSAARSGARVRRDLMSYRLTSRALPR